MKTNYLNKLMCLLTCLAFALPAMAYDFVVDGIYYNITSSTDKTVEVTYKDGTDFNSYSGDIVVPGYVINDGSQYTVTSIGESAFRACKELTSIKLNSRITSTNWYAFRDCPKLKKAVLSQFLVIVAAQAFYNCTALETVYFGGSLKTIDQFAFFGCTSLKELKFPDQLETIDEQAFAKCTSLTEVTLPNSLTALGEAAFWNCTNITDVVFGTSEIAFWADPFENCTGVKNVSNLRTVPEDIIGDIFTKVDISKVTLYVPVGCKAAYETANYWKDFGTIKERLPEYFQVDGLFYHTISPADKTVAVTMDQEGFMPYEGDINIPSSVTYDGITAKVIDIEEYTFYSSELGNVTIPNSITSIAPHAFENSYIKSINIPNSVTTIGESAFKNSLFGSRLVIPNSVTTIEGGAFACCFIRSIAIPNSVKSIGGGAFSVIEELGSLVIPDSEIDFGSYVFAWCPMLTSVTNKSTKPQAIDSEAFEETDLTKATLYVPKGCVEAYKAADVWKEFGAIKEFSTEYFEKDGIFYHVISDSDKTAEVTWEQEGSQYKGDINIPANAAHGGVTYKVTSIADDTFLGNEGITSVAFPNSMTDIEPYTFDGCVSLKKIDIPEGISRIWKGAFYGCTSLTSVTNRSTDPQDISYDYVFAHVDLTKATLYVPKGCIATYKAADVWKDFGTIKEIDESGIDGVDAESVTVAAVDGEIVVTGADEAAQVTVYAVNGSQIYAGSSKHIAVVPGLYFVKVAGAVKKVIVK